MDDLLSGLDRTQGAAAWLSGLVTAAALVYALWQGSAAAREQRDRGLVKLAAFARILNEAIQVFAEHEESSMGLSAILEPSGAEFGNRLQGIANRLATLSAADMPTPASAELLIAALGDIETATSTLTRTGGAKLVWEHYYSISQVDRQLSSHREWLASGPFRRAWMGLRKRMGKAAVPKGN